MKKIIIIILIIAFICVPAYLYLDSQKTQKDFFLEIDKFNSLLKVEEYEQAYNLYENASSTLKANYNISLDIYVNTLIEIAKTQDTAQEGLDKIYAFNIFDSKNAEIENAIITYEAILQSNYSFELGVEYYNNKDIANAMVCFGDVIKENNNYIKAQEYLLGYNNHLLAWNDAVRNNEYGRSPLPNSIARKDMYMYIPYKFNNTNTILKINTLTLATQSFPIVSNRHSTTISNINIIGEYIYFLLTIDEAIAIEDNPKSAVYRIKTTGEELTKVTDCDYFYLISYQNYFYALSYTNGLVKVDNNFREEEILVDNNVILMQMAEDGIYYTVKNQDKETNTQYIFDGENHKKISEKKGLHYYKYDNGNIIYYKTEANDEYMYYEYSKSSQKTKTFFHNDLYEFYGVLNDSVIFTRVGKYQQECIRVFDLKRKNFSYICKSDKVSYVPIGICYEDGCLLLYSDAGISITNELMRIQETIAMPHINSTVLFENEQQITLQDETEYYADKEILLKDDNQWIYSDEDININVNKKFIEQLNCTVYITHIRTLNNKSLQILDGLEEENPLEILGGDAIWAISGDSISKKVSFIDKNSDKKVINKDVYIYNEQGMFVSLRQENLVSVDRVLDKSVLYTFTEGTIIVENTQATKDCFDDGQLLLRSGIGMVEPGHYVTIVVATDDIKSKDGIALYALAQMFIDEGCQNAYCFNGENPPFGIFKDEYIYQSTIYPTSLLKTKNQILYFKLN